MNIVAPMTFIFSEIEDFHRIQGEVCYIEMQKSDPSVYGEGFLKKASGFDINYIILSPYYRGLLGLNDLKKGDEESGFRVIEDDKKMIILQRTNY